MKRPALCVIMLLLLAPRVSLAGDPPNADAEAARAERLFYEARALMEQYKYVQACPKLEESLRLDPGIGTLFNLADCNEHIGRLPAAWAGFLDVAAQAKAAKQPERAKIARARAEAGESRLPKKNHPARAIATPLTPTTPTPATPATAAPTMATTAPTAAPAASEPPATPTTTTAAAFPPPIVEEPGAAQRTAGWIITGVGVVGVGIGAGFGLSSLNRRDEARAHCAGDRCDATGIGLRDDAIRRGNIATISIVGGGAALLGGLALLLTAPSITDARERAGRIRALPSLAQNSGGIMLQGAFQ
jgi:tetratricopeptide (TPR) repeat protein